MAVSPEQQRAMIRKQQMLQQLPQCVEGCYSDHAAVQFECSQRIRKLLSIEQPPIKTVIDSGVVPRIVEFLKFNEFDRLQFEAAWILTNIASGTTDDTTAVIRYGAIPLLVKLLQSINDEVKEQALWALGNISGDNVENRNLVLSFGALSNLLPLCNVNNIKQQKMSLLRIATWTLSIFCGKPCPDWKYIEIAIKALTIMITSDDTEILENSCIAFQYLSDDVSLKNEKRKIETIKNNGSLDSLIELIHHKSSDIGCSALKTIENIGSNEGLLLCGFIHEIANTLNIIIPLCLIQICASFYSQIFASKKNKSICKLLRL